MSGTAGREPPDLISEAAEWLASLDAGSADISSFEAWRNRDPRNAAAFAQVAASWRSLDVVRFGGDREPAVKQEQTAPVNRLHRRDLLRTAAAAAAITAVGGALALTLDGRGSAETIVGQRQKITVMPGTILALNTDSRIEWRTGDPLRLWLDRGEIAIRSDRSRTVELVTAAGRLLLSPGAYNVRLRDEACEIAILAGRLTSGNQHSGAGRVVLAAAGRITAETQDAMDPDRILAWQHDTLVLNGESLDYAVAEMNRYMAHKIIIADPVLSRLRIGGTFTTKDPTEFLQALRVAFDVRATTSPASNIILTRA